VKAVKLSQSLRVWLLVMTMTASAAPTLANCNPPAGMPIQQWYAICSLALQQAYSMGQGQGMSFANFVQAMYGVYAQPVGGPLSQGAPMGNACNPGALACFNGWLRTCQMMPTGSTLWITGAQRCN